MNGDYTLSMNNQVVKHEKFIYETVVADNITFALKHIENGTLDFSCFFYCTEDGKIPEKRISGSYNDSNIQEIVIIFPIIAS